MKLLLGLQALGYLTNAVVCAGEQAGRPGTLSVWPVKSSTRGGGILHVSGSGIEQTETVQVGAKDCKVIPRLSHASHLACRLPALEHGKHRVIVVRRGNSLESTCGGDSRHCEITADDAYNAEGSIVGPQEYTAGDTVHIASESAWEIDQAAGQVEITLGGHPVHIANSLSRLEANKSSERKTMNLQIHVPQGLSAGTHELRVVLNARPDLPGTLGEHAHGLVQIPSPDITILPKVSRVVVLKNESAQIALVRIFGSGFALNRTRNEVIVSGKACNVLKTDYHLLEIVCPGLTTRDLSESSDSIQMEDEHQGILFSVKDAETAVHQVSVKNQLLWPVTDPHHPLPGHYQRGAVTARSAPGTVFVAPTQGWYRFTLHCPEDATCSFDLPSDWKWFESGDRAPFMLNASLAQGQSLRVSVDIETPSTKQSFYAAPGSWFLHVKRRSGAGIAVTVNGLNALHAWEEPELFSPHQVANEYPVDSFAAAAPKEGATRTSRFLASSEEHPLSEWLATNNACGVTSTCVIPQGVTCVVDKDIQVHSLIVRGTLRWRTSDMPAQSTTTLGTGFLVAEQGGVIDFDGTSALDRRLAIYIKNNGAVHPKLGQRSLGSFREQQGTVADPEVRITGFPMKRTWTLLSANADKGSRTVQLEHEPGAMGWKVGDRIVIANANLPALVRNSYLGPEEFFIDAVDGKTLTLGGGTLGQRYLGDAARNMQCEVINLSRNIVVTGDAPTENVGLHIVGALGGSLKVSNTRIERCGQRGIAGKYCLHFHLMGDCGGRNSDGFASSRCVFQNNAIEDSHQRGIVVHGSHRSLTEGNVLYKVRGAGIYIEDGNEMENMIKDNVNICHASGALGEACRIAGTDNNLADDVFQSGLWGLSVSNHVIGNRMVNHENGLFMQVTAFPFGRGAAAGKVCTVHAPFGIWRGNVQHSNWRFGFYLDSQWPRNVARSVASNGLVADMNSCSEFTPDGRDNGKSAAVEDIVDWGNDFVGQYELGDVQYLRHYSVNNLKNMYWKHTKNFADTSFSAHVKDSTYGYFSDTGVAGYPAAATNHILGPGGHGAFIIENTTFFGGVTDGAVASNQHCGVGPGTGGLCTPTYVLDTVDFSKLTPRSANILFGASGGIKELAMYTAPRGQVLFQDYMSVANGQAAHLLSLPGGVCRRSQDIDASAALKWNQGILCKLPLRRLQVWSSDKGTLRLVAPGGGEFAMNYIVPCPGSGEACVHKRGYGAPVAVDPFSVLEYSLRALELSPSVTLEFSDTIFGTPRFGGKADRIDLALPQGTCAMRSSDDRLWIGPFGPKRAGRGSCRIMVPSTQPVDAPTAPPSKPVECPGPYPVEYPECENRIQWMISNWNKVDWKQKYIDNGVDGSRCSIQRYLSSLESYCPNPVSETVGPTKSPITSPPSRSPTTQRPTKRPTVSPTTERPTMQPTGSPSAPPPTTQRPTKRPTVSPTTPRPTMQPTGSPSAPPPTSNLPGCQGPYPTSYKQCAARVEWMLLNWDKVAWKQQYADNGVDGTRCSVQEYLSTVEAFCPAIPPVAFVGCFSNPQALKQYKTFRRTLTPVVCADLCSASADYVALSAGNKCLCLTGSSFLAKQLPGTWCSSPCVGDKSLACGGPALRAASTVYRI